jgi:hypothetical protein
MCEAGLTRHSRSPYLWYVAAMFRRKSSPQESSARLWWGLAVAYLVGVLVYVSIEWVYFGATFWTALIEGAFAMVFPVAMSLLLVLYGRGSLGRNR